MLLRASAKFGRQYSCPLERREPPVQPFPLTWNLDVISHSRSQLLVLASEEYTLFSLLIPTGRARNPDAFLTVFRERLLELLENVRIRAGDLPDFGPVTLVGRTDRRIIGSQNDLIYLTKCYLEGSEKPASPETLKAVEEQVNSAPMSYLAMESPLEAFYRKTALLKGGSII
jgi:hypothetical protein